MSSPVGERHLHSLHFDNTFQTPSSSDEDSSARSSPTFSNGVLSGLASFQSYTRPLSPLNRRASQESFASFSTTSSRGSGASPSPSSPIEAREDGLYLMSGRTARNAVRGLKHSLANNQPPDFSEGSSSRYQSKAEWNQRLEDTEFALDLVDTFDLDSVSTLAHYEQHRPVGVVVMQPPLDEDETKVQYASLELIATHPNSSGVATRLIEEAVNLSHEWGCGGRISLSSMTDGADKAYHALGFTSPNDDGEYTLDPARSTQWHLTDDGWRREKAVGATEGESD